MEPTPENAGMPAFVYEPGMRAGTYANFARVNHSLYEFTIDFARLDPSADGQTLEAVVVARVAMSPLLVSQLSEAIQENWAKYAKKALPPEVTGDDPEQGSSDDHPRS